MVLLLFPHFMWKLDPPKWIWGRREKGGWGTGLHYLWGFHVLCNEINVDEIFFH
jgi:hypothetical protein